MRPRGLFLKPSDHLKTEIVSIKHMLSALNGLCSKLDKDSELILCEIRKTVRVICSFVDHYHNAKEVQELCPELEKVCSQSEKEKLNAFKKEGLHIHDILKSIKLIVSRKEGPVDTDKLIKVSKEFIELEKKHINEEESFIIPLLKTATTTSIKGRIEKRFKHFEDESFGKDRNLHQAVNKVFHRMSDIYSGAGSMN